jgi:hypothetical protein
MLMPSTSVLRATTDHLGSCCWLRMAVPDQVGAVGVKAFLHQRVDLTQIDVAQVMVIFRRPAWQRRQCWRFLVAWRYLKTIRVRQVYGRFFSLSCYHQTSRQLFL